MLCMHKQPHSALRKVSSVQATTPLRKRSTNSPAPPCRQASLTSDSDVLLVPANSALDAEVAAYPPICGVQPFDAVIRPADTQTLLRLRQRGLVATVEDSMVTARPLILAHVYCPYAWSMLQTLTSSCSATPSLVSSRQRQLKTSLKLKLQLLSSSWTSSFKLAHACTQAPPSAQQRSARFTHCVLRPLHPRTWPPPPRPPMPRLP